MGLPTRSQGREKHAFQVSFMVFSESFRASSNARDAIVGRDFLYNLL